MPTATKFTYFLYSLHNPVNMTSEVWSRPLPLNRQQLLKKDDLSVGHPVCHKEYYTAAQRFLEKNTCEIILQGLALNTGRDFLPEEIEEIRICLVKHGEFYHPSRIEAVVRGNIFPFVLNIAVTGSAQKRLELEYAVLEQLNREFKDSYLPEVYSHGVITDETGGREFGMFLGEWFENFCEFHTSKDPSDNKNKIKVWDVENGDFFLTRDQAKQLYMMVAMILTQYYNAITFEHIFSWHHAGGDFVLKRTDNKIDVRLITVRQYVPVFNKIEPDESVILHALLIFFLNLTIRTRLDRLDGTGEITWADDVAVKGTVEGFYNGLEKNSSIPRLSETFLKIFREYMSDLSKNELVSLLNHIADTCHPRSPDLPVIRKHLEGHATVLHLLLNVN